MILLGNLFSFFAAIFTISSSWQKTRNKIYGQQCIQCTLMAIASFFLYSYSGMTTFILCAIRNFLLAKDKFTQKILVVFLILIAAIGIIFNNRGILGYIPIVTTILYSIGTYLCKKESSIKINIVLNLLMWAFYEFYICDYVSVIVDGTSACVALLSLKQSKKL